MNERSVVSFSLRKLSRDNSHATYFNSRFVTSQVSRYLLPEYPDRPDHYTHES